MLQTLAHQDPLSLIAELPSQYLILSNGTISLAATWLLPPPDLARAVD